MANRMKFRVREGRAEDAERIAEFVYKLEEFEGLAEECDAQPDRLREHLFGPNPYARALIAESEGRAIGCAIFHFTYAPWKSKPRMFLQVLYVDDEARGTGAGEALLRRVVEISAEARCCGVDWHVIDWNERAMKFYESKFGAKPSEGWTLFNMEETEIARVLGHSDG